MELPGRKSAEVGSAVTVTGRSSRESQYGEKKKKAALQCSCVHSRAGDCLSCNYSKFSEITYVAFQVFILKWNLCCFRYWSAYKLFWANTRGKNIWEKSGILQTVTFLEHTLEPDVPLKSICGQGLCRETNCYERKNPNYSTLNGRKSYTKGKKKIDEGYIRCPALTTVITHYYPSKKRVGSSSCLLHRWAAGCVPNHRQALL